MTRAFRVYEKKRGHRRTGSPRLASAGEALFFAGLLLIGCAALVVLFATIVVPQWRARQQFVRGACVVLDKRLARQASESGVLYRPEVQIEYTVDGGQYRLWTYDVQTISGRGYASGPEESQAALDAVRVGGHYVCWYDPADPTAAVLIRSSGWWVWLVFTVPVSCILVGSVGLVYQLLIWGKSTERRAALAGRTAVLAPFTNGNGHGKAVYPNVPSGTKYTESPGTALAYRLPIASPSGWKLLVWLAVVLVWNGTVAVFVMLAVGEHLRGQSDWLRPVFLLPFALIGLGLLGFFIRELVVATAIGPTLVEISEQPLRPGCRAQIMVHQTGRLAISALEVFLVCDEEATFRQGTDTRKERRRVFEQPVLQRDALAFERGDPVEICGEIDVPRGAMHSFKSAHNEINWKLVVRGKPAKWPPYERSFPIVVYPADLPRRAVS